MNNFDIIQYLRQYTDAPKLVAQNLADHFGKMGAAYVVQQSAFRDQFDLQGIADVLMEGDEFFEPDEIEDIYRQFPQMRKLNRGQVDFAELAGMTGALEADDEVNAGYSWREMDDVPSYDTLGAFDRKEWRRPMDYRPGAVQPTTKAEAEQFRNQRFDDIIASRKGVAFNSTPLTSEYATAGEVTVTLPEAGQALSTFSKANAAGKTQGARSLSSGRFVKMADLLPTEAENRALLEEVAEWLRGQFVKRYEALPLDQMGAGPGGEGSGTLKRAVSEMTIEVKRQRGEEFSIKLRLPDISRPSRHQGDPAVSVRYYGPRVFKGRVGLVSRGEYPMRFQIRGEWMTARNVRPSRKDLNVLEVTTEMRQQMTLEYLRRLQAKIKARQAQGASA